jgi:hypothetical protein
MNMFSVFIRTQHPLSSMGIIYSNNAALGVQRLIVKDGNRLYSSSAYHCSQRIRLILSADMYADLLEQLRTCIVFRSLFSFLPHIQGLWSVTFTTSFSLTFSSRSSSLSSLVLFKRNKTARTVIYDDTPKHGLMN